MTGDRGRILGIETSCDETAAAIVEQGVYGECEGCGEEIGLKRLEARPVAELCIDCKAEQEKLERHLG